MKLPLWSKREARQLPLHRIDMRGCCVMAMVILITSACSPLQLSSVTSRPSGHHQPGQVVWHDLLTKDVDSAKRFYGQLFGWEFEPKGRYTVILNKGAAIAGIVSDETAKAQLERGWWLMYLSIADIDDTAAWVVETGGELIRGPGEMVGRGRYVVIKDPQGAPLVLLHSATGDPGTADPVMNGWLWNELWTKDTEAALQFYQFLGGYSADLVSPVEVEDPYWVLVAHQRWQAGITSLPFEDVPSQWVPAIRVADPVAVADRAARLGGRVLIRPDHPLGGGHLALIEDPSGGIFMVESWAPDNRPGKEQ